MLKIKNEYVKDNCGGDHELARGKDMQLFRVFFATGNSCNQSRGFVKRRCSNCHREGEGRVARGELQAQKVPEGEIDGDRHENGDPQENRAK